MSDAAVSLLLEFVRTKIRDRRPRATTGKVRVDKQGHVMVVKRFEPLPAVLRKFAIEGFLSAPVQDNFGSYCGIVTMLDLVKYTSDLFYGKDAKAWIDFWNKEDRFHQATVDDVMKSPNMWSRDPYPPLSGDFTRFHVLETMVRTGARAISVVNVDQRVTGFETQSRLISFLRQKLEPLSSLAQIPVERIIENNDLEVFAVKESDPAINAYNIMVQKNVTGLAIVNAEGMLVGAISTHDLRAVGFDGERFNRLFQSVKDFKAASSAEFPKLAPSTHFSVRSTPVKPLYVSPNNTLEDVVGLMNDGNIHRIWVCSQDSIDQGCPMPIAVVSQLDVLRCALDFITESITWS